MRLDLGWKMITSTELWDLVVRYLEENEAPEPEIGWHPVDVIHSVLSANLEGMDDVAFKASISDPQDARLDSRWDEVRLARPEGWPLEIRNDCTFRCLVALHDGQVAFGQTSRTIAELATAANVAESTVYQSLGEGKTGLVRKLTKGRYQLVLDPKEQFWLRERSRGSSTGRLTTLEKERSKSNAGDIEATARRHDEARTRTLLQITEGAIEQAEAHLEKLRASRTTLLSLLGEEVTSA